VRNFNKDTYCVLLWNRTTSFKEEKDTCLRKKYFQTLTKNEKDRQKGKKKRVKKIRKLNV